MANQTTDVELRIRATNYSKKTTTEVVDALKELTRSQDAQIESAKKGTAAAADLEKGYNRIEAAAKALVGQQALIKLYEQQAKTLAELQAKLEAARKAQKEYTDSLDPTARRTAEQERNLKRLAKAVADVEKAQTRAEQRMATTSGRLNDAGISAGNMAEKQRDIVAAVNAANAALAKQENAIEGLDAAQNARRAAQADIAQREQQVRVDNLFAQAERDLAKAMRDTAVAQQAAARSARDAAEAEAMRNVQHEAEMEALFTREANKRTEAVNRQAAAMRTAANEAERMMRASASTARGAPAAPVAGGGASAAIRDIQDPAAAALRSVDGLESAIASLGARVAAISGPVRNYRDTLREATAAQEALSRMAGQVDTYNRQIAAVRAARAEYTAARAAVNALVAEMRSGAAGEDITTRLRAAQSTLDRSAAALGNLTTQARGTQAALRAAGVDTRDMAGAEANLISQAGRAATSLNQLSDAFRRNGAAADNAGSRIFNWFGGGPGGRSTLSYTQRLRGELLSLASGFVGVYAAIELVQKVLEAYRTTQAVTSQLTAANGGDARKAAEDFKYLEAQADRIGFVFKETAPAYAKFSIAMRAAGFSTQQTRYSFEQIAGSAVQARMSAEDLTGMLKAFEQMASKGKIQAEELRGQLGDRLPGAFQIAARAAEMTVAQYTKAMEMGDIGSERVIQIAREMGKTYGVAEAAGTTLMQAEARFQNATQRFLNSTAEGGFAESYQQFLTRLTTMLNDGTADRFAKNLSAALVAVVDVMQLVVDNADLVKYSFMALIGIGVVRWLVSLPTLFRAVAAEIAIVNGTLVVMQANLARASAAAALSTALGATGLTGVVARLAPALIAVGNALLFVARAVPVIGAAVAAYQITKAIVDGMDDKVRDGVQRVTNAANKATDEAFAAQAALARARGTKEEKELQERYDRLKAIAVKAIEAQGKAVAEAKAKNVNLSTVKFSTERDRTGGTGSVGATADPGDAGNDERKLEQLREALAKRQTKIDRDMRTARLTGAKKDLEERLSIINEEFDAQRKSAQENIKDEKLRAQALAEINKTAANAQAVERTRYNTEQARTDGAAGERRVKLAADIADRLGAIEDDIKKRAAEGDVTEPYETRRAARIKAIGNAYDDLLKKIREEAKLDPTAGAEAKRKLDMLTAQRQVQEGITSDREEADRLEKEFNDLLTIQKTKLDAITAQVDTGMLSIADGVRLTNEQIAQAGPGIEAAGRKAVEFAAQVSSNLNPVRFAEIMSTVAAGVQRANVDATTAANNVNAAQQQLNNLLAAEQRERDAIQLKKQLGVISSEQEAEALNAVTLKYGLSVKTLAEQLLNFVNVAREAGGMTGEQLAVIEASANRVLVSTQNAVAASTELDNVFVNSVVSNGSQMFDQMAQSIAKVVSGQESLADGFKGAAQAAGQFFAQLMRDLAMAIIKTMILKALQSQGGGIGGAATSLLGGMHTGGIVGSGTTFKRRVDPALFLNAPRFHDGGLPGLKQDEVPTILQKGEEVLSKGDPRNILNGGGGGSDGGAGTRFVLVDDRAKVAEAMQSAEGEKVTLVHLKRNISTLKQWIK